MRTIGRFLNVGRTVDGSYTVTFEVGDDLSFIEGFQVDGADLILETKKYYEKRSLDANGYFWKLCDMIARKAGSDKDTIYKWMLHDGGVWQDVKVVPEAVDSLKRTYRLAEAFDEYPDADGMIRVRCYIGSSHYDKQEMAFLIDKTVEAAKIWGVDTWTPDEIKRVIGEMK